MGWVVCRGWCFDRELHVVSVLCRDSCDCFIEDLLWCVGCCVTGYGVEETPGCVDNVGCVAFVISYGLYFEHGGDYAGTDSYVRVVCSVFKVL